MKFKAGSGTDGDGEGPAIDFADVGQRLAAPPIVLAAFRQLTGLDGGAVVRERAADVEEVAHLEVLALVIDLVVEVAILVALGCWWKRGGYVRKGRRLTMRKLQDLQRGQNWATNRFCSNDQ